MRLLAEELKQQGIRTRATKQSDGRVRGGVPFGRGGLRHLLQNRLYLGEIVHKGVSYPGAHEPIVTVAVFEQVQQVMAEQTSERQHGTRAKQPSLLSRLVYDGHGRSMAPSHAVKAGKRYRYYITHPRHIAVGGPPAWRMPAHELEQGVVDVVARFLSDANAVASAIAEVADAERLQLQVEAAARGAQALAASEMPSRQRRTLLYWVQRIDLQRDAMAVAVMLSEESTHTVEASLFKLRRGNDVALHIAPPANPYQPRDEQLVALLADAWAARLATAASPDRSIDELASIHRVGAHRFKRLLRISYLAPSIIEAALDGRQPCGLTVANLNSVTNIPHCWTEQRRVFGVA